MNVAEFIAKWQKSEGRERADAQQHFLDLCELAGHPKPAEADPTGATFTFEKGASKQSGGEGWADAWKKDFFGWEYKGKHKDLRAAYDQLLQYRESLENPPLLVVCDMDRIQVHTNFTAAPVKVHEIQLQELAAPRNLEILRAVFHDPNKLKPGATSAAITAHASERLGDIALRMRGRGLDPHQVARFLDRIVFCLFAEDVELLPKGLFCQLVRKTREDPARFRKLVGQLFEAMSGGGDFGAETIRHFNGDLFAECPVPEVTTDEIEAILAVAALDWAAIDPSIFGTLFERGMDPAKRSQIGAHYTSRADIETVVEPVVMQPLRREWQEAREIAANLLATGKKKVSFVAQPPPAGQATSGVAQPPSAGQATSGVAQPPTAGDAFSAQARAPVPPGPQIPQIATKPLSPQAMEKARREAEAILRRFLIRLQNVKVLDPACGSGNFLYVALQKLKDLEKEISLFAGRCGFTGFIPGVGPWQLYGIEINEYAHELAQMTVWIGYLQWIRANGFGSPDEPILRKMKNIACMDAIVDLRDPANPKEPDWPTVDFIVGNPPFLGGSKMLEELGRTYQKDLWALYKGRVPGFADLCCYWFEKARHQIEAGKCKRAGLLATQGIRGGANREVLKRIKQTGDIFFAVSDRDWFLDGANVHVSMVGFDDGGEKLRSLDGKAVPVLHANLTARADVTLAQRLIANGDTSFSGTKKSGHFEVTEGNAITMLGAPNPHGRPNSDVLRPWLNGRAIVKRMPFQWIIDAGTDMLLEAFALYETPQRHVLEKVKPQRNLNKRGHRRDNWWLHAEVCRGMRQALGKLDRYVSTPRVSKYRIFIWTDCVFLPDDGVFIFARSDDYFFGVLHSRLHELWARAQGTQLRERESGFRYTPTTCFETFPFPRSNPDQEKAIADAAKNLDNLRNNWLNPPEWTKEEVLEFPGSVDGPWARYVQNPDSRGIGTVRYPRIAPRDAECAKQLAKRTLTNLYNQRPAWLDDAHRKLDSAVFAAYGWDPAMRDEEILGKLLALNAEGAAAQKAD